MPRSPTSSKEKSKNEGSSSPGSNYYRLEDGVESSGGRRPDYYRPPVASSNDQPPQTKYEQYKRASDDLDTSGIASVGSFSQSKDFQKMLKEDKKAAGLDDDDDTEIYLVQQKYAYCSISFSLGQVLVLAIMMIQCGVAPFKINPMIGPYPDALSDWGGKNAVNILEDGEWWRLVTPIMLHAGIIHLVCNVAVQLETGAFFEREWGSAKWLIIYLSSAVGSSILSVIFMPQAISVGSSGAVMGLFGAKLSEVICRFCESDKTEQGRIGHQVRKEQCAGVTCSVVVVMLFSFIPYVDWAAHLGGLLAGFCVGMVVFSLDIVKQVWKLFWLLSGIAVTVVFFAVTLQHMYSGAVEITDELRDVCGYYQQYFDDYQCNCMRDEQNGE